MIKIEETEKFIHHYSDEGYYIRQIETGILYEDSWDTKPCRYTYEEAETKPELPPEPEPTDEISAHEALEIITGGLL